MNSLLHVSTGILIYLKRHNIIIINIFVDKMSRARNFYVAFDLFMIQGSEMHEI